jgi:protein-tyrosine phosphatase
MTGPRAHCHQAGTDPARTIELASLPNLRDLGGVPTGLGPTRWGQVFRSTALDRVTEADAPRLGELGIGLVIDLRGHYERRRFPDRLPAGCRYLALDVLADAEVTDPSIVGRVLSDPVGTTAWLSNGRSHQFMLNAYRDIVALPSALAAYRSLMLAMADPGCGPILFHCATGKDRTGWAAAMTLEIAGAPRAEIMSDYLQTTIEMAPVVGPILSQYERLGGDPEALRPLVSVAPEFLETAYRTVDEKFGSFRGYLHDGLALRPADVAAIRRRMLG